MTNDPVDALSTKTVAYASVFASIAAEIAQAKQAKIRAKLVEDRQAAAASRTNHTSSAQRPHAGRYEADEARYAAKVRSAAWEADAAPAWAREYARAKERGVMPADWAIQQAAKEERGARASDSPPAPSDPDRRPGPSKLRQMAEQPAPPTVHPATRAQLLEMHRDAEFFYRQARPDSWVPEYMKSRGLEEMLQDDCPWKVGYAPGGEKVWAALTNDLHGRGWSDEQILAAGLGIVTPRTNGRVIDRFHDRMVISAQNEKGETVGFVGRSAPGVDEKKSPKYLNSSASEIYDKSQILLGVGEERELLAAGATPVIVEGALDAYAVTAATSGQCVGVAPSGTALTAAQVDVLDRASNANPVIGMDGDDAGKWATVRAYELLQPIAETPRAVIWPAGQDPASMWAAGEREGIASYLERPGPLVDVVVNAKLDAWLDRSPGVEGRVNAARDVAMTVVDLPVDQIGRQVAHVAKRLDLETSTVTGIVTDTISERDRPPANRSLDATRESEMAR